jgi:hypothetical protein
MDNLYHAGNNAHCPLSNRRDCHPSFVMVMDLEAIRHAKRGWRDNPNYQLYEDLGDYLRQATQKGTM